MAESHEFRSSPNDVFRALLQAISELEKPGSNDPNSLVIDFRTKTSGWSWGSGWRLQVFSSGVGSTVTANMTLPGSVVAALSEKKRIDRLWGRAEAILGTSAGAEPVSPNSSARPIDKNAAIVSAMQTALHEAEIAAAAGDILAEERAIAVARRAANSAGVFNGVPDRWLQEELQRRTAAGNLRRHVDLIGVVGRSLVLMSDRVVHGETAYVIDASVVASVEVGGQVVHSSRPTLTRMAMGSVLPGSALLVGLAVPKKTTSDQRRASFVLAHPRWRVVEPIDPDAAHDVAAIASQINALAAHLEHSSSSRPSIDTEGIAEQIAKLAGLRDQGILTEEEFRAAKARLVF